MEMWKMNEEFKKISLAQMGKINSILRTRKNINK